MLLLCNMHSKVMEDGFMGRSTPRTNHVLSSVSFHASSMSQLHAFHNCCSYCASSIL